MSERKVVLKMVMSLDGFVTSPDGSHEWMFEWFGEDSGEWSRRALEEAGVHAMGRRSYEIMGPHWAASEGPIATSMNEKPKAVFSRTLKTAEWANTTIAVGDTTEEINKLRQGGDGHIVVWGGVSLWRSLMRLDLIDEFRLDVHPYVAGEGTRLFDEVPTSYQLDLVASTEFSNWIVGLHYRRHR
jgi:dihydrofolate reductase